MNRGPGSVAEPSGITQLIDGLVRQNLGRDPTRRLLPGDVVTIEAVDADVAVSLRPSSGGVALLVSSSGERSRPVFGMSLVTRFSFSFSVIGGHPVHTAAVVPTQRGAEPAPRVTTTA